MDVKGWGGALGLMLPLCSHEDGTVRFWDASGVALRPLYKLSTAGLFQTDCEHADSLAQAAEDDWPPFRKVRAPHPFPAQGAWSGLCLVTSSPPTPAGGLLRPLQ